MFFLLTRRERLVLHRLSPHMQRTRPSARFVIVFVRTRAVARKRIGAARFHRITGGVRERPSWSVERARALFRFVSSHSPSRLLVEHPLDSVHPARVVHVGVPELLEERLRLGSAYTLLSENHHGRVLVGGELRRVHESHVQGVPGGVDGEKGSVKFLALVVVATEREVFRRADAAGAMARARQVALDAEDARRRAWVADTVRVASETADAAATQAKARLRSEHTAESRWATDVARRDAAYRARASREGW